MEFAELCYRRLTGAGPTLAPADYIEWADQLLIQDSDSPSIEQLASCAWETPPDAQQVERLFQESLAELGLALPIDEDDALKRYAISICQHFLDGALEPWDLVREMLSLSDDNQEPYLFKIWTVLCGDLSGAHSDHDDNAACIRNTARQFIALCAMPLPDKFPLVWRCSQCRSIDEDDTEVADASRACPHCGVEAASKNMRYFENRDAMIEELSASPSLSSAPASARP